MILLDFSMNDWVIDIYTFLLEGCVMEKERKKNRVKRFQSEWRGRGGFCLPFPVIVGREWLRFHLEWERRFLVVFGWRRREDYGLFRRLWWDFMEISWRFWWDFDEILKRFWRDFDGISRGFQRDFEEKGERRKEKEERRKKKKPTQQTAL